MAKKVILIHPSDEMYGADKVLLEVIESFDPSVNIEVWLPTDITYPKQELTNALYERGIKVRHLRLPILRRSLMTTSGLIKIAGRFLSGSAALLKAHPQKVYLNTAATAPMVLPAKLAGANVIVHLHEYLDGIRAKVTLPLLRRANHVIAVSDAIASVLPKSISQHTSIVHNGFDLPTPTPAPSSGPFRLLLAMECLEGPRNTPRGLGKT